MKLTIGHLYPDLLNLYGDRGNIQCMKKRLLWRGIEAEIRYFDAGSPVSFSGLDIVLLGGGSDREQELVCRELRTIREDIRSYVEDGGGLLAVCGGYQLLGTSYDTADSRIEGLGLLDLYTLQKKPRLISDIILENSLFSMPVTGFENHGGRTYVQDGRTTCFGHVLYGTGSPEGSGTEGVMYKNVIGTYLHGPLLPKNPEVCDLLLSRALERKYGRGELAPLDDTEEKAANRHITERFLRSRR